MVVHHSVHHAFRGGRMAGILLEGKPLRVWKLNPGTDIARFQSFFEVKRVI